MFEDNKFFGDYVKDQVVQVHVLGAVVEFPMDAVIENITRNIDHEQGVQLIRAIDAYFEDAGVTEEAAKALIGSWLQVVRASKDDDKKWVDETKQFLKDCLNYLEG